ncbi:3-oxoacyl-ACP synthase III family protein [Flavobacterium sp.]|uniref:3-oxoacyl-ACP synthase III family protein n=1 Tax=Flavobacterium sp. TaxID=239 RepID=UPI0025F98F0A|nr:ketoacyl-ACP synthase III [Flavobacterium sp.]
MLTGSFQHIKIAGLSVAVPKDKVAVDTFSDIFGAENIEKFKEMTGVQSVSRAKPNQTASDLGYEAAVDVFEKSKVSKIDIGFLIFVTQKPDYRVPSTAFVLHKRLELPENCLCFDLNLACSGFIFGLQTILSLLDNSESKAALLITGDTSVKTLSPHDRTMVMLFGDSGSATLLEKTKDTAPVHLGFRTDGHRFKSIITPAGAYRNRHLPHDRVAWSDGILRSDYDTHMKGMDVFGFSITDVPQLMKDFMTFRETTTEDYDFFILHQANNYILKQLSRKLKIPTEKIPVSLDRFGNNSSNSIPLVLADHFGGKHLGNLHIFICGFGAGLSLACGDLVIDTAVINPLLETDSCYLDSY